MLGFMSMCEWVCLDWCQCVSGYAWIGVNVSGCAWIGVNVSGCAWIGVNV